MTELTEERFEQILTEKLAPLAAKQDVDELARITKEGFDDVHLRFAELRDMIDVQKRVKLVEHKIEKIAEALHITL